MQAQAKISEYDQQAIDFLESTGTEFSIQYLYTGEYFHDDKEPRDIYQFTLKNSKGVYSSKFGDSLNNTQRRKFINDLGSWSSVRALTNIDAQKAKKLGIRVKGAPSFTIHKDDHKAIRNYMPSAYDILACLDTYVPDTFEDFCDEYGYNDLPITKHDNVMRIFLACREQAKGLKAMYSESELEQLAEIA